MPNPNMEGDIEFNIFADMCSYIDDPSWEAIFMSCARGVFPNEIKFDGKKLSRESKNRPRPVVILPTNLADTTTKCIEFMISCGIRSTVNKRNEMVISLKNGQHSWSRINNHMKDLLIRRYIDVIINNIEINELDKKLISLTISCDYLTGKIDNDMIKLENGEIKSISKFNKYIACSGFKAKEDT